MSLNLTNPALVTPTSSGLLAGQPITQPCDLQGGSYVSQIHGRWYAAAKGGNMFTAGVTAVTLPLMVANMASVFSIYNPIASTKWLELIYADIGVVLATTVVNTVGLYYEKFTTTPTYTARAGLSTIAGGSTAAMVAQPCSALTHVAMGATDAATARLAIIHTFGAVTTTGDGPITRQFEGSILVPPGVAVSLANSTAAAQASSVSCSLTWAEWPI